MGTRAVRGAVDVVENTEQEILGRTQEMLKEALAANSINPADIVSIVFVLTGDLNAAFPAKAARELGLTNVPLLDMVSPDVPGSMPRVVRMLMTWNTDVAQDAVRHAYLGRTAALRPDLAR
jgi:chorismate mutase